MLSVVLKIDQLASMPCSEAQVDEKYLQMPQSTFKILNYITSLSY